MNDHELSQLLRRAASPDLRTPDFHHRVWSRIEMEGQRDWRFRLNQAADRFFGFFAMRSVALATCMVMLIGGAWMGNKSATSGSNGEMAYLQSISPFAHSHR